MRLLPILILLIPVFLSAQDYQLKYTGEQNRVYNGFTVTPLVSYPMPKRKAELSYDPALSGGFRLGFSMLSNNGKEGVSLLLSYQWDRFTLKPIEGNASFHSVMILAEYRFLRFLNYKMGFGGGALNLSDEDFNSLSQSTRTELGGENKKVQWTDHFSLGCQIPLGSKQSINLDYDFLSVDRAMMFWHRMLFSSLQQLSVAPFTYLGERYSKKERYFLSFLSYAAAMGIAIAWYDFDYEHHNWPWKDPKPMRFHRATISFTYYFGESSVRLPHGVKEI